MKIIHKKLNKSLKFNNTDKQKNWNLSDHSSVEIAKNTEKSSREICCHFDSSESQQIILEKLVRDK